MTGYAAEIGPLVRDLHGPVDVLIVDSVERPIVE